MKEIISPSSIIHMEKGVGPRSGSTLLFVYAKEGAEVRVPLSLSYVYVAKPEDLAHPDDRKEKKMVVVLLTDSQLLDCAVEVVFFSETLLMKRGAFKKAPGERIGILGKGGGLPICEKCNLVINLTALEECFNKDRP